MEKNRIYAVAGAVLCAVVVLLVFRPSFWLHAGNYADDTKAGEAAIEQFHSRLSTGQYAVIYDEASQAFQQSGSKQQVVAAMKVTTNRYGGPVAVTHCQSRVVPGAPLEFRAVCNTTFEKRAATEMFLFFREEDGLKLAMYRVFPGTVKPGERR